MPDPSVQLLDLPVDILYLIFPYLDVSSFVALTSTCKALHQSNLSQYAPYWSSATRTTFRVPNQPVVENDGERWQKMYRRLMTESRCFTWGKNDGGCLGHGGITQGPVHFRAGPRPRPIMRRGGMRSRVSWPTEMDDTVSLGIIADMQCGGWSTNLLTSKGGLYTVGVVNGRRGMEASKPIPEKLRYPAGLPHPDERYEPATAIKQFSAGRSHVLAVSDGGNIWSWGHNALAALQVKFLNIDLTLNEKATPSSYGCVKKVVAGWAKSAAFVVGTGIVVWDPVSRHPRQPESEEDTALVMETAVVPRTHFQKQPQSYTRLPSSDAAEIGEVQNFICLEHFIVFNTHLGKAFAAKIEWGNEVKDVSDVREIRLPTADEATSDSQFATDVQGTFRSFAIFTRTGAVLTGTQDDHLNALFSSQENLRPLNRIPALQHAQVISIAFGDYHFHALHAPGYITSYGNEPGGCGCLGLGGDGTPEGRIRGLRYQGMGGDARLVPHAYIHGRRVWFEHEKQKWITFLTSGGKDPEEAKERMRMCSQPNVQGEVSEWVEQEGNAWEERFGGSDDNTYNSDGLGSYFALSVTAAGHHSGALVLVNEGRVNKVREGCLEPPHSPSKSNAAEETTAGEHTQEEERGFINSALGYAGDLARWFLGSPRSGFASPAFRDPNNPDAFSNPMNHGALNEDGRPYVWAQDSFPRLRLANGAEMPGTVEFNEWRYGQPQWEGKVEGY